MRLTLLLALIGVTALHGCSPAPGTDSDPDGGLVACDTESGGDALCQEANPSTPVCIDGACHECREASTCPDDKPVCADNACQVCGQVGASSACAERDPTTPACSPLGQCVECVDHGDCASEVCERGANTCVPEAQIVYVEAVTEQGGGGMDTPGCGIPAQPCLSLEFAVTNRIDESIGRTWVKLAEGNYANESEIRLENQSLRIVGAPNAVIFGQWEFQVFILERGVTLLLDQVSLRPRGSSSRVDGIFCTGPDSVVRFERGTISGGIGDGASLFRGCRLELLQSVVRDNDGLGIRAAELASLWVEQSEIHDNCGGGIVLDQTDFVVRNNFIYHNGRCNPPSIYGGIQINIDGPNERVFEFNTVVENWRVPGEGAAGVYCRTSAPIEIKNSIIWGNDKDDDTEDVQVSGFCEVSYSNVQGGVVSSPTLPGLVAGEGNIDTDPLFVDPFRADYRIEPGSPAKDAADPEATLEVDVYGEPRPFGPGRDIGAHEVQE